MSDYGARERYQSPAVASIYDDARFRSWFGRFYHSRELLALRKGLEGLKPGAKILDIPCGTGRFLVPLLERGYKVAGADVSLAMINQARGRHLEGNPNFLGFFHEDLAKLSFTEKEFDCVVCMRLLGIIRPEVRQRMFLEMKRIAGNRVIAELPMWSSIVRLRRALARKFKEDFNPEWYPLNLAELRGETKECDLKIKRVIPVLPVVDSQRIVVLEV